MRRLSTLFIEKLQTCPSEKFKDPSVTFDRDLDPQFLQDPVQRCRVARENRQAGVVLQGRDDLHCRKGYAGDKNGVDAPGRTKGLFCVTIKDVRCVPEQADLRRELFAEGLYITC